MARRCRSLQRRPRVLDFLGLAPPEHAEASDTAGVPEPRFMNCGWDQVFGRTARFPLVEAGSRMTRCSPTEVLNLRAKQVEAKQRMSRKSPTPRARLPSNSKQTGM